MIVSIVCASAWAWTVETISEGETGSPLSASLAVAGSEVYVMWEELALTGTDHHLYLQRVGDAEPVLVSQALDGVLDVSYLASFEAHESDPAVHVVARAPCAVPPWSVCGSSSDYELEEHTLDRATLALSTQSVSTQPADLSALTAGLHKGKSFVRANEDGQLGLCYTTDFAGGLGDEVVCNFRDLLDPVWPVTPAVISGNLQAQQDHPTLAYWGPQQAPRYSFTDGSNGWRSVAVRLDSDDGLSSATLVLSGGAVIADDAMIAVSEAGDLHVVYHREGRAAVEEAVIYKRCGGGAVTDCDEIDEWNKIVLAEGEARHPSLAVYGEAVYAVYEAEGELQLHYRCGPLERWTRQSLDRARGVEHALEGRATVAVDREGGIHVAYTKDLAYGTQLRLASSPPLCP